MFEMFLESYRTTHDDKMPEKGDLVVGDTLETDPIRSSWVPNKYRSLYFKCLDCLVAMTACMLFGACQFPSVAPPDYLPIMHTYLR